MEFYSYFKAYSNYFWTWEEGLEVLSIPKSSTIAYFQYIFQILEFLSEQGLPPFGSLLLVIIATNKNVSKNMAEIEKIIKNATKNSNSALLDDVICFLNMLSELPQEYKEGNKRKLLFQVLFEKCHNIVSQKRAKNILDNLKEFMIIDKEKLLFELGEPLEFNTNVYIRDFRSIALLQKKFPTIDDIIDKIANLPELKDSLDNILTNEHESNIPKDFVQELIENYKTFHIGVLIKRLWSGLSIPLHNTIPSKQALGGVSDLTNKGDFDKLLISEFANEDIVFLSRLSNNEALYLQRESPPTTDNPDRIILLDISLKNWGTPKILAYAILVAIAKHPKTNITCKSFALGNDYYPIKINTIEALIDSLQLLEGSLHAGKGLEKFFKEYHGSKRMEIFFISSSNALNHPEIKKVINENYSKFKYWINVNQEGVIDLFRNQHNSKTLIQTIKLPLETLFKKNNEIEELKEEKIVLENYPILFPFAFKVKKLLPVRNSERAFVVSAERALFRFYEKAENYNEKGLEIVLEKLPFSLKDFEIAKDDNGDYILLCFNAQNKEITFFNTTTKEEQNIKFKNWKSSSYNNFFFYKNNFYYMSYHHYWKIQHSPEIDIIKYKILDSNFAFIDFYYQNQEELFKKRALYGSSRGNLLKNIDRIFINKENNLVFNKHELSLTTDGRIIIFLTNNNSRRDDIIFANNIASNTEFLFPNGNSISINRSGMLILKSVIDNNTIYIPSVLDNHLGVATKTEFAGNEYYYKSKEKNKLQKIDTKLFFEKNIRAFIKQIRNYGT